MPSCCLIRPAGTSPISSTSPATQDEAKISEGIARANGGSCTPYRWPIPQKRKPIHHRLPASRHTYAGLVRGPASFDHLVGAGAGLCLLNAAFGLTTN